MRAERPFVCSPSTPYELAKPAPRSICGIPGKAVDESAPEGKHRTAQPCSLTEKDGPTPSTSLLPVGSSCAPQRSYLFLPDEEGGFGRNPRPAPFGAPAPTIPCGASGLGGAPTPDAHHSYSITLLPHLTQPGSQSACGG